MRTIHVAPGSELDRLLEDFSDASVEIERRGIRYRLNRIEPPTDDDIWTNYDPARVDAALVSSAGALAGVDVDALLADLAAQRA
jgi:hypothetical protein